MRLPFGVDSAFSGLQVTKRSGIGGRIILGVCTVAAILALLGYLAGDKEIIATVVWAIIIIPSAIFVLVLALAYFKPESVIYESKELFKHNSLSYASKTQPTPVIDSSPAQFNELIVGEDADSAIVSQPDKTNTQLSFSGEKNHD